MIKSYGLIGYPLSHSFSKKYFTEKFQRELITDHVYELFPIESISRLPEILSSNPTLAGLNVTIPYKEQVIQYLDSCSPVVEEIGACNCIKIEDGKLTGYNTDVIGFAKSLEPKLKSTHRKALVLGTGGAAKAVHYALKEKGIDFLPVSRKRSDVSIAYEDIDEQLLKEYTLIVNTTPLGMHPDIDKAPDIPYQFIGTEHYLFDLVYNPPITTFLSMGKERGAEIENGADMLVIQAEASWDIWNQ
ncbi:MAG: shikimate dehydrogenase family protein [bacterium]